MDLRKLAKGKPCQIRIPMVCTRDRGETVLAHYRLSGWSGGSIKPDDWSFGAWSCAACHDVVDGRAKSNHDEAIIRLMHAEGCLKTQALLRDMKKRGEI